MPAKKTTAAKKAAAPKPAAKQAAAPAAKKAAAKKGKTQAPLPEESAAASAAPAATPAGKEDENKPKASDLLKRTRHHTPAVFKVAARKAAPVVFTLDDVRDILKRRAKEDAKRAKEAQNDDDTAKKATAATPAAGPAAPAPAQQRSTHGAASLADILGFSFGGGATAAGPATKSAVPKKHKKYYDLLVELRDHVRESLGMHANDTLKRSQKEDTGDLSTSSDAGTDTFDRDFALSVVSSEQEALSEIEAAIRRIHNGTYGVCEITGEPISDVRLEAVPFTRYSLEGQRQHEQTARRRIQRAGSFFNEGTEGVSFGEDDGDN